VTATYTRTAGETVQGGPYPISATLSPSSVLANYSITYNTANFTIGTKAASVMPNPASKTYGASDPTFTGTLSGFLSTDHVTATDSRTAGETVLGGPYTISATLSPGSVLANYIITYNTASFTINPAPLTVTASPETKTYGQTVSFGSGSTLFTSSGLQNGETIGSVTLAVSNNGGAASAPVGTYTITPSAATGGTFTASNYTISYAPGTLTITVGGSIYVLDPTVGGALTLSSSAAINTAGNVVVDSTSSTAVIASGNAKVTAASVQVAGGVSKSGNASVTKTGNPSATGNPFASLPEPAVPSYSGNPTAENVGGSSSATISQGLYSQITVSSSAHLTLNPGVYVIAGGGVTVSGNAVLNASGVTFIIEGGGFTESSTAVVNGAGATIFNAVSKYTGPGTIGGSYGPITLSGSGNLSAPTSGTYSGILIFQPADNTRTLTLSGTSSLGVTGTIDAPGASLVDSGGAQLGSSSNPLSVVVDRMTLGGYAIVDGLTLTAPAGTTAYSPAQVASAYGINSLSEDGTSQTIAIVDAYHNPDINLAVDAFDGQFGLTSSGASLYQQYGAASSFLTVLNQSGQSTSLPTTDPAGQGADNWEVEEALDVEWAHAVAPGAKLILVEANSQALSDLMAAVATAAAQPGVSVVSMSWGFPEGQAVFAADEAEYDSTFQVPGVTFVASTGDYGVADLQYPAFLYNVVAVGGTSLSLNAASSYQAETGWGYNSAAAGTFIGSGGGISLYEPEPAYQANVQSTGGRTTPDVALVADPATGAWIADPYNLDPSNPFEVVGGTSLSAPAWAGILALVNQGRLAAGHPALNSASPTEAQQALYALPQSDYHAITGGTNGYAASAGYNLVTGLGTPVASQLVSDLVSYAGPGTAYVGPKVAPLQNATRTAEGANYGGPIDVYNVFDSLLVSSNDASPGRNLGAGSAPNAAPLAAAYFGMPGAPTWAIPPMLGSSAGGVLPSSAAPGVATSPVVTASESPMLPAQPAGSSVALIASPGSASPIGQASLPGGSRYGCSTIVIAPPRARVALEPRSHVTESILTRWGPHYAAPAPGTPAGPADALLEEIALSAAPGDYQLPALPQGPTLREIAGGGEEDDSGAQVWVGVACGLIVAGTRMAMRRLEKRRQQKAVRGRNHRPGPGESDE
jgi:hypothetical protein